MNSKTCFVILFVVVWFVGCDSAKRLPDNAYLNKTEFQVCSLLGQPESEFAGHYGNPPLTFTQKFHGEVKTLVFRSRAYDDYVTFEKQPIGWLVIRSSCVSKGTVF